MASGVGGWTDPQAVKVTPSCTFWAAHPCSRRLYQFTKPTPVIAGMSRNMLSNAVTCVMSQAATSPVKPDPRNISLISVTSPVSQLLRSWSNDSAKANIPYMSVTEPTFQAPMSSLKEVAPRNIPLVVVTLETSQPETGPVNARASRKASDRSVVPRRLRSSAALTVKRSAPWK